MVSDNLPITVIEVLTGSFLGVIWSPWLFALQDAQERSGER
jgi:hypothetical protein